MTGLDVNLLWHSFLAALIDLIGAIRKMPSWLYLLLLFMAGAANVIALLIRGGL